MVDEKGPVLPFGSFLFPRLFQAFRMSIQPTKLILAFLALATICLAGRVMDFSQRPGSVTASSRRCGTSGRSVFTRP